MRVLIVGGSGFIGRNLVAALRAREFEVCVATRRSDAGPMQVNLDFTHLPHPSLLAQRLRGIDVIVNAVGILRERGAQTFDQLHVRGPQVLFEAAAAAGVPRVLQISALGARTGTTRYFTSKQQASGFLATLDLQWTVIEPSVVYGPGGTSAQLFTLLASLPCIPLPSGGVQRVQPVHIDDVTEALVALIVSGRDGRTVIPMVGPEPLRLRDFLASLRQQMRLGPACVLPIPGPVARLGAQVARLQPDALLDADTLAMLDAGNTGDPQPLRELLGRPARPITEFIPAEAARGVRRDALLAWLLPLLRCSIAAVWIWTAIVSFGWYPVEQSYALLAGVGITGALATLLLYGAAALDLLLGIGTLVLRRRRWLWYAQIAVILTFTTIITIAIPEHWLHPFGPLIKNLPMLAAIGLLLALEEDRAWTT